uniref:C2H2-type domain-containing protein n=1 Tax=Oryzias sinensis TaxID=183150 RepID=A0A8C7YA31_9TELE
MQTKSSSTVLSRKNYYDKLQNLLNCLTSIKPRLNSNHLVLNTQKTETLIFAPEHKHINSVVRAKENRSNFFKKKKKHFVDNVTSKFTLQTMVLQWLFLKRFRGCVDENQIDLNSHMSAGQCDSDVRKNPKKPSLGKKRKQSPNEERLFSIGSGESVRIITNLSDYMETGTDERCYICKECGKSFGNISQFKIHARIHAKRFSCNICEKSFSSTSNLDSHLMNHRGIKPFSCKECDKSYSYVSHLKRHMITHTGERPYWCMECRKGFMDLFSLKTHMRIHTGKKPFSCEECKKSFSQKGNLKIHMRTHKAFS